MSRRQTGIYKVVHKSERKGPDGEPLKAVSVRWRVRWTDAKGKRRSQCFDTMEDAKSALARLQNVATQEKDGVIRPKGDRPLAEAAKEWLARRKPGKHRDNEEDRVNRHIIPFLGNDLVRDITEARIQVFARHLEKTNVARHGQRTTAKLSPQTVKHILVCLGALLRAEDCAVRIKYKVATGDYEWIRTPAEVGRFIAECSPDWFRIAAALAIYAGLRKGEVAALRRSSIDWERGLIDVVASYDGPTKGKMKRHVPLSPELATLLRPWLLAHKGPRVVTADGHVITEQTDVAQLAHAACKRAGIVPSVNYQGLRHTYASHLAERASLAVVGAILGHKDPKTTQRYAHLDTESLARDPRLHLSFTAPAGEVVPIGDADRSGPKLARQETDEKTG